MSALLSRILLLAFVALPVLCGIVFSGLGSNKMDLTNQAVFAPRVGKPVSFDPLDADKTVNLLVMRMLNLTPIEVSVTNRLTSQVLSEFSYDPSSATIKFIVRSGNTYSDGSPLTTEDVAFAIARMAYTRPKFPVICEIKGLAAWTSLPHALHSYPKGIVVVGQTISIQLNRDVENPLFRFALEIFGIVPKSSIDLTSNKLKAARPPTSGNYVIATESDDSIKFRQRLSPLDSHGIKIPEQITFRYFKSDPDLTDKSIFTENLVFAGIEAQLRAKRIDLETQGLNIIWTPASNFYSLVLNPHFKPFENAQCRQVFATTFREEVARIFGDDIGVEPSIFPEIIPGYLSTKDLIGEIDVSGCLTALQSQELPWANYPKGMNDLFNNAIAATAEKLGMRLRLASTLSSLPEHEQSFAADRSAFLFFGTGFWPLDPVGDIRMLFTPHMHPGLKFISEDENYMKSLDDLGKETVPEKVKARMQEINRATAEIALFNPVAHFRKFFVSSGKKTLRSVPLAVQQPYAWQAFNIN